MPAAPLLFVAGLILAGIATLPAAAADRSDAGEMVLSCYGEEPFWHVEVAGDAARLARPGAEGVVESELRGEGRGFDFLDPAWVIWRGPARPAGQPLVLVARQEECRSTMADGPPMSHRALVSFPDGAAAVGCCELGPSTAGLPEADLFGKPGDDWSGLLFDLMPAIGRCAAEAGPAFDRVLTAMPADGGLTVMRLGTSDGRRIDCTAGAAGDRVARLEPIGASEPAMTGEGEPAYLFRGRPDLPVTCGRVERVMAEGGMETGYLVYRAGC